MTTEAAGATGEPLTYQELLRTLGTLLDEAGSQEATIVLSERGAAVTSPGWQWVRQWDRDALLAASQEQRARRQPGGGADPPPDVLRWRLRVVGAELDTLRISSFVLTVDPGAVKVQGPDGYERTIGETAIRRRGILAPYLRGQTTLGGTFIPDPDFEVPEERGATMMNAHLAPDWDTGDRQS